MFLVDEHLCELDGQVGKLIALLSDVGWFESQCKFYFGFGGTRYCSLQNETSPMEHYMPLTYIGFDPFCTVTSFPDVVIPPQR